MVVVKHRIMKQTFPREIEEENLTKICKDL